jgi:outer membrane protein TolC
MPQSTRRSLLAAFAASAALAACTTVGPDFTPPAPPATPGYAMAGDPASARVSLGVEARDPGPWWNALGSGPLDTTIRAALAGNPTLAEANATLERAQAQADAARGARRPEANFAGNTTRERINTSSFGFTGFPSPTISLYSIGSTISYDLDLFGGRRRAQEAAEAEVERQARNADAAYLTLTGNVAIQAVRLATLRAQIATIESVIADDRWLLELIHAGQRAGGTPQSATTGGETQLAQDLALLPPLQRQVSEPATNWPCWSARRRPTGPRRNSTCPASPCRGRSRWRCRRRCCAAARTSAPPRPSCTRRPPASASPRRPSIRTSACRPTSPRRR